MRGLYDHLGTKWTAKALSEKYGIPEKLLKKRISRGMPIEKAIILDLKKRTY